MQFDTSLNAGLYITNDIDARDSERDGFTVAERLPLSSLSVEVWFTLEKEVVILAGLVCVLQEAKGCSLGWSLTYDRKEAILAADSRGKYLSTYLFKVALQRHQNRSDGSMSIAAPAFVELTLTVETKLLEWHHIVGTYNGSHLVLFYDGIQAAVGKACDQPPCGNIVYTSSQTEGGCMPRHTALTIGTMEQVDAGLRFPHQGLLKRVRISASIIEAPGAFMLYEQLAPKLSFYAPSEVEYWVKASFLRGLQAVSPSIDMVHAETQAWVTAKGNFRTSQPYKCKFTFGSHTLYSNAKINCSTGYVGTGYVGEHACTSGFADQVTCLTPKWREGFKAVTLSLLTIVKQLTSNLSSSKTVLWKPLLQRVCVRESCGYTSPLYRYTGQRVKSYWYTVGDRNLLSPSLGGGLSYIRTMTPGAIYRIDNITHRLTRLSTFMTGMSDAWGTPLRNRYIAAGVSRYSHISLGGEHYILGATSWNGKDTNTSSGLYHFNESSGQLKLLQEIDTYGARNWLFFRLNDTLFAAVANYNGPSAIYKCQEGANNNQSASRGSMLSLQTSTVIELDIRAASSMTMFSIQDTQFLLISAFSNGLINERAWPSLLYKVSAAAMGAISVQVVQELAVSYASDVTHFRSAGFVHVIFAVNHETLPSLIFSANLSEALSSLDSRTPNATDTVSLVHSDLLKCCESFAATVPTRHASSVRIFELIDEQWLTVTVETNTPIANFVDDTQVSAKVMRFNGTHFNGKSDPNTKLRDTAGGQLLNLTSNTQLVYVQLGETSLLLAGNFLNGDDGVGALQVLESDVVTVEGLNRPISVAVSPVDGKYLYVASVGSEGIAVFERDMESGELRPSSVLLRPSEASATLQGNYTSLQSIRRIAISPDQRHLYATLTLQDMVVIFSISNSSGAVHVQDRVTNEDLSFDGQDGLLGAFGIHVSIDGANVYVSGYTDGALVAFSRNSSDGSLAFMDAVRDGQRIFEDYEDIPLDVVPNATAPTTQSTSVPSYPSNIDLGVVTAPPRATKYISFEGKSFLAVASTSPNWDIANGALTISEWKGDAQGNTFS